MHYTKSTAKNATPTNSAAARIAPESSSSSAYAMMNSPRTSMHLARGSSSIADEIQRIRDEMMRIDMTKSMNCGPHQPFTI
ncbi:hypothetical protein BGZ73_003657 [Actinomortierella ambigua]|nr:hypothetical protein BGZ73_003657 [Actinomortierella ambigua]